MNIKQFPTSANIEGVLIAMSALADARTPLYYKRLVKELQLLLMGDVISLDTYAIIITEAIKYLKPK